MLENTNAKKKVVLCHGCFDVVHLGHIKYLEAAKAYGDHLIVTITSDRFVGKGPGRPYFSEQQRKSMLEAIRCVDEVHIIDGPTAVPALTRFQPDFYVKGPDYRDPGKDVTGEIVNERSVVEAYGGELVFTEEETFSSSTLINRFFAPWTDDQKQVILKVKDLGGYDEVFRQINRLSSLNVLVVGEPITDVYRFCEPENISSKSPSISARFLYEESYDGGTTAIANHLKDFATVSLLCPEGFKAPQKTRYIAQDKQQRIFEITDIEQQPWQGRSQREFIEVLSEENRRSDCTLLADFGHGLFEGDVLYSTQGLQGFVGLNVQTNSSNHGFNVFKKHKRYDYLSIDMREARLAYHDRHSSPLELQRKLLKDVPYCVAMTLGKNGSYYNNYFSPAFADQVVDATGAGDAFFALTALLCKIECPPAMIPFIGNVYAGLKTKIIGNKSSVPKAALLKAVESILK